MQWGIANIVCINAICFPIEEHSPNFLSHRFCHKLTHSKNLEEVLILFHSVKKVIVLLFLSHVCEGISRHFLGVFCVAEVESIEYSREIPFLLSVSLICIFVHSVLGCVIKCFIWRYWNISVFGISDSTWSYWKYFNSSLLSNLCICHKWFTEQQWVTYLTSILHCPNFPCMFQDLLHKIRIICRVEPRRINNEKRVTVHDPKRNPHRFLYLVWYLGSCASRAAKHNLVKFRSPKPLCSPLKGSSN